MPGPGMDTPAEAAPLCLFELASRVWNPAIIQHIAKFLTNNEIACTLRLVEKATALEFKQHTKVLLSEPCPESAFERHWRQPGVLVAYRTRDWRDIVSCTGASGSIANLKTILEVVAERVTGLPVAIDNMPPGDFYDRLMEAGGITCLSCVPWRVAKANQAEAFRWLIAQGFPCEKHSVVSALEGGSLELATWILQEHPHLRAELGAADVLQTAARFCSLAALQHLYGEWVQTEAEAVEAEEGPQQQQQPGQDPAEAAEGPQQHGEDQANQEGEEGEDPGEELESDEPEEAGDGPRPLSAEAKLEILAAAAASHTRDWMAKTSWLEGLGIPRDDCPACDKACAFIRGVSAVQRVIQLAVRGYSIGPSTLEAACHANNSLLVEYLLDAAGLPLPAAGIVTTLAVVGSTGVLFTLHSRGLVLSRAEALSAVLKAAGCGKVGMVVWLVLTYKLTSAELEGEILFHAVKSGSVELVTWLCEELGCRLEGRYFRAAAHSGCEAMLRWLVDHGCPMEDCGRPYQAAAFNNDMVTLLALKRVGCPMQDYDRPYLRATRWGNVGMLRCLTRMGFPFRTPTARTFNVWARSSFATAGLRWLVEEAGCRPDWPAALNSFWESEHDAPQVEQWLLEELERWRQQRQGKRKRAVQRGKRMEEG